MQPIEKIFEDSLRYPSGITDPRIFKELRGVLSRRAQRNAEFAVAVVMEKKLVVVCERPKQIKEAFLVERRAPERVFWRRLALKRKKNSSKA